MSVATVETNVAQSMHVRRLPQPSAAVHTDPSAKPARAPHHDPLARLAALMVSIARNNSYEGRDPMRMPDAVTSGFVAELLGIEIDALATLLIELNRRGLIENCGSTLELKDMPALERLAA